MNQCSKCRGLVPEASSECPNCGSGAKWWKAPLAFAGAGLAMVTFSACYGPACATTVKLPDGGTRSSYAGNECGLYDCNALPDGGPRPHDAEWNSLCVPVSGYETDAGSDGGADGGARDGGADGGP